MTIFILQDISIQQVNPHPITSQSSSNIDVDELDKRYLQKSGGTITNNLLVNGSVDIKTSSTIPNIGNVENAIDGKQPTINDGDLTIAKTSGLETALNNKQDDIDNTTDLTANSITLTSNLVVGTTNVITEIGTKQDEIQDGDLTIAKTDGLQTALNDKQDDIDNTTDLTANSLTLTSYLVVGSTNVITELGTKQDEINTDDLAITDTAGLETALAGKQPTIGATTDLTSKSLTTTDLVVNESLNIDNVITYEKYKQFDTLVMRRQNEYDTRVLNPNEIQVFVNNDNILHPNPDNMTSYFAKWSAKSVPIASISGAGTELVYNASIQFGAEIESAGGANALIIKNMTPTFVDKVQVIVMCHRANAGLTGLTIGLIFELYNSVDDPDLLVPLAETPIITNANYLHIFDFPALTTYTNGFFSNTYGSTSQIPDTTKSGVSSYTITTLNIIDAEVNITSKLTTSNSLITNNLDVNNSVDIDTRKYFDTIVIRRPTGTTGVEGDFF